MPFVKECGVGCATIVTFAVFSNMSCKSCKGSVQKEITLNTGATTWVDLPVPNGGYNFENSSTFCRDGTGWCNDRNWHEFNRVGNKYRFKKKKGSCSSKSCVGRGFGEGLIGVQGDQLYYK